VTPMEESDAPAKQKGSLGKRPPPTAIVCVACRNSKVKCDLTARRELDRDTRCSRCERIGLTCTEVEPHKRGRPSVARSRSRLSDANRQLLDANSCGTSHARGGSSSSMSSTIVCLPTEGALSPSIVLRHPRKPEVMIMESRARTIPLGSCPSRSQSRSAPACPSTSPRRPNGGAAQHACQGPG
jgi:hypothetical protein